MGLHAHSGCMGSISITVTSQDVLLAPLQDYMSLATGFIWLVPCVGYVLGIYYLYIAVQTLSVGYVLAAVCTTAAVAQDTSTLL